MVCNNYSRTYYTICGIWVWHSKRTLLLNVTLSASTPIDSGLDIFSFEDSFWNYESCRQMVGLIQRTAPTKCLNLHKTAAKIWFENQDRVNSRLSLPSLPVPLPILHATSLSFFFLSYIIIEIFSFLLCFFRVSLFILANGD